MRINAKAQVNDSTYVRGRFTSNMNFKDDADANTKMDVLFVHHQFGDKVGMNLGRNFLTLGQTGMYYDDFFDGAQLFIGDSKLTLEAGYGRMNTWINDYGQKKMIPFMPVSTDRPAVSAMTRNTLRLSARLMLIKIYLGRWPHRRSNRCC